MEQDKGQGNIIELLTERILSESSQEFIVALMAGCEMEYLLDEKREVLTIRTKNKVGMFKDERGGFIVGEKPKLINYLKKKNPWSKIKNEK